MMQKKKKKKKKKVALRKGLLRQGFDDFKSNGLCFIGQEKEYRDELEKMKEGVKELIEANQVDPLVELELIDVIQQLGLDYHFEAEIQHALDLIHKRPEDSSSSHDLCATALRFRLLRQHGRCVSQGAHMFSLLF